MRLERFAFFCWVAAASGLPGAPQAAATRTGASKDAVRPRSMARHSSAPLLPSGSCQRVVVDGEASAGQSYERSLGGGLLLKFEAVPAGWIVRVLPTVGARPAQDYAELATPPYHSLTPLAVTTDYSFRAQDAVGWNPRRFQFLTDASAAARAAKDYGVYMAHPDQPGAPGVAAAMAALAELPEKSAQGELRILDARLVPGTANQAAAAALVVSHWAATPHTLEQPSDGKPSALGKVEWVRFRITVYLPAGFRADASLKSSKAQCGK